jgi:hypothetical protein
MQRRGAGRVGQLAFNDRPIGAVPDAHFALQRHVREGVQLLELLLVTGVPIEGVKFRFDSDVGA